MPRNSRVPVTTLADLGKSFTKPNPGVDHVLSLLFDRWSPEQVADIIIGLGTRPKAGFCLRAPQESFPEHDTGLGVRPLTVEELLSRPLPWSGSDRVGATPWDVITLERTPLPGWRPGGSISKWVDHWFSGKAGKKLASDLHVDLTAYKRLLTTLEREAGALEALFARDFKDIMARPVSGLSEAERRQLVDSFVSHLGWIAALTRSLFVAFLGRPPLAPQLAQGSEWLHVGTALERGLVSPARLALRMVDAAGRKGSKAPGGVPGIVAGTPFADERVIKTANILQGRIGSVRGAGDFSSLLRTANQAAQTLPPLASINRKQIADAELSRSTFCEDRLGISAGQAVVLIAISLLQISSQIKSLQGGASWPSRVGADPGKVFHGIPTTKAALYRTVQLLRSQTRSDRHAAQRCLDGFDDHNGKLMVNESLELFSNGVPRGSAKLLCITIIS